MIRVNVIKSILNRLKDRGWKSIPFRGYTNPDVVFLKRLNQTIIGVQNINIDASGNIMPQIEVFFSRLIELIKRTNTKIILLPGGGDVPIPDFFTESCEQYNIEIHLITIENWRNSENIGNH